MKLEKEISKAFKKVTKFVKPTMPEGVIYAASWPVSVFCGVVASIFTDTKLYIGLAASAPQILEYSYFRACELGILGRKVGLQQFIKEAKE